MNLKLENRNSKLVARHVTHAQAGFYEVADCRLRGNDLLWAVFEFRVSNFDSLF
jgi:hypothetical protein